jgi:ADP-ribosylglycohydrolase
MSNLTIPYETYRKKVLGCWLGKAVGGTLGGPWEGKEIPHELTFYEPVPTEMIPNDDLDLQIVWLQSIRERGLPVTNRMLSRGWRDNIHMWPDEYGVCRRNLDLGLLPPLTGAYDNGFVDGMGAAIRTEIWACLAPGDPELAAHLAWHDASCDHDGDGIHAATFLAVVESAAFLESDPHALIEMGLAAIPKDCRVSQAIRLVLEARPDSRDRETVLEQLKSAHHAQNFTDVPINLGIIVLGWLAGRGDFGASILAAVNCGYDTDCTGASLGAILGLIDPDGIGERWLEPIGRQLVLSSSITGMAPADTLDELVEQTADLSRQVLTYYESEVGLDDAPPLRAVVPVRYRQPSGTTRERHAPDASLLLAEHPLRVVVSYPSGVRFAPGEEGELRLSVTNTGTGLRDVDVSVHSPEGWRLDDRDAGSLGQLAPQETVTRPFAVIPQVQGWRPYASRLTWVFDVDGVPLSYETGLLMTMPFAWWRAAHPLTDDEPALPDDARSIELPSHFLDLTAFGEGDPLVVQTLIKSPRNKGRPYPVRLIVQSPGETRVWLNGSLVNHHPGDWHVPAIHRARHTGVDLDLPGGANRLTVAVSGRFDGSLFHALGDPATRRWRHLIEYADPLNAR